MTDIEDKIRSKEARIAVVGLGYIGTCIGAVVAGRGYTVLGIDVRKDIVDAINRGETHINEPNLAPLVRRMVSENKLIAATSYENIAECDVILVTVGTPLTENFEPDTRDIVAACTSIQPHVRDGQLIIIKSTLPPGVTEQVVKPVLDSSGKKYHMAFCPERLAEGKAITEFESIPVVVGGVDVESAERAAFFWQEAMGLDTIRVESAAAAEFVKLADNLWIDLNIALANELAMLSEKLGIDALQVIAAANTLPKGARGQHVNILSPSVGVGGYCLTKDPWFVQHLGQEFKLDLKIPAASRGVNEGMPQHSISLIREMIERDGRKLPESRIAILGLAFKSNTGDCRYTPTAPIVAALQKSGCDLVVCDPLVSEQDAAEITSVPLTAEPLVAIAGADAILFLTGHDAFTELGTARIIAAVKKGAIIFDGRNFFDDTSIGELRAAGLVYKGVGR